MNSSSSSPLDGQPFESLKILRSIWLVISFVEINLTPSRPAWFFLISWTKRVGSNLKASVSHQANSLLFKVLIQSQRKDLSDRLRLKLLISENQLERAPSHFSKIDLIQIFENWLSVINNFDFVQTNHLQVQKVNWTKSSFFRRVSKCSENFNGMLYCWNLNVLGDAWS